MRMYRYVLFYVSKQTKSYHFSPNRPAIWRSHKTILCDFPSLTDVTWSEDLRLAQSRGVKTFLFLEKGDLCSRAKTHP